MAYAQAHRQPLPSSSRNKIIEDSHLSFSVDPAKLNPSFEAYKLVQDDTSPSKSRSYGLPSRPPRLVDIYQAQQAASRKEGNLTFTGLGYKETKERALHQILIPSSGSRSEDEPFAAYIDANSFLVVLTYDVGNDKVVGHPVHRIAGTEGVLPSLASISATEWVICNGEKVVRVKLQKVKLGENAAARWISEDEATWKIAEGQGFTIKACKRVGGKVRILVQRTRVEMGKGAGKGKEGVQGLGFQRGVKQEAEGSKQGQSSHSQTTFELRLLELDDADIAAAASESSEEAEADASKTAKLLWTVQGEEPLVTAAVGEQAAQAQSYSRKAMDRRRAQPPLLKPLLHREAGAEHHTFHGLKPATPSQLRSCYQPGSTNPTFEPTFPSRRSACHSRKKRLPCSTHPPLLQRSLRSMLRERIRKQKMRMT